MRWLRGVLVVLLLSGCAAVPGGERSPDDSVVAVRAAALGHLLKEPLEASPAGTPQSICLSVAERRPPPWPADSPLIQPQDAEPSLLRALSTLPLLVQPGSRCEMDEARGGQVVDVRTGAPALEVRVSAPEWSEDGAAQVWVDRTWHGRQAHGSRCTVRRTAEGWQVEVCVRTWVS